MLITRTLLAALSLEAVRSPRRRKNRNLHAGDAARAHRPFNAMEPESYVRPHRHLDHEKAETIIAITWRFGLVLFDAQGGVVSCDAIACDRPTLGIDIPSGTFHTVVALDPGSVFFEAKAGPYFPPGIDETATWAPAEGAPEAPAFLQKMQALFA